VVAYGGKTFPRWRTAAILKIDMSPYLSEKSSDFHEILYTAADFELDERHVIKNEKVALNRLQGRQNVFFLMNLSSSSVARIHIPSRYARQPCCRATAMLSPRIKKRQQSRFDPSVPLSNSLVFGREN